MFKLEEDPALLGSPCPHNSWAFKLLQGFWFWAYLLICEHFICANFPACVSATAYSVLAYIGPFIMDPDICHVKLGACFQAFELFSVKWQIVFWTFIYTDIYLFFLPYLLLIAFFLSNLFYIYSSLFPPFFRIESGALILFNKCLVLQVQVTIVWLELTMLSFSQFGFLLTSLFAGCSPVRFICWDVGSRGPWKSPSWSKNHRWR